MLKNKEKIQSKLIFMLENPLNDASSYYSIDKQNLQGNCGTLMHKV